MALNLGIHLPPRNHLSFHSLENTAGGEGEKPSWKINWEILRAKELISVSVLLPVPCSARCHFPLVFLTFRSVWQLIKFHTWSDPALGNCHIPAAALWGHRPSVFSQVQCHQIRLFPGLFFFCHEVVLEWCQRELGMCTGLGSGMGTAPLLYTLGRITLMSHTAMCCQYSTPKFSEIFSIWNCTANFHSWGDHLGAGWECSEKQQTLLGAFPLPLS